MCDECSFGMPVLKCMRTIRVEAEWLASSGQRKRSTKVRCILKEGFLVEFLQEVEYVRVISDYNVSNVR